MTIQEALAAFQNEPKPDDELQRVYIYGYHTPYRVGERDTGQMDVLAGLDVRGDAMDALRALQVKVEDLRQDLALAMLQRFGPNPPIAVASAQARAMKRAIEKYEQDLLIEWANVEISSGAPWRRVAGIWVAT